MVINFPFRVPYKARKKQDVHVGRLTLTDPTTNAGKSYIEDDGSGNVKIFNSAGTGVGLSATELGLIDGLTPGTVTASKAVTADANKDVSSFRDVTLRDTITTSGVGAPNGTGVTATEYGTGAVHKTVLTLTNVSITVTDTGGANGGQGSLKVYDFPEGVIQFLGASYNLTTLAGAGGIGDTAALVGSLGSVAAGAGDATLTSTEADMIASTTGTLTAGAGTLAKHGSLVATAFDGHTTALDAILNLAVPDAGISSNDTVTVNGTITMVWANLGDY